jgi:hypothetical protein
LERSMEESRTGDESNEDINERKKGCGCGKKK